MSEHSTIRDDHIADILKALPMLPGVYRMLDKEGGVLYVGKAKQLKNRVSSYFQKNVTSAKTIALVKRIFSIDVTITASETEALLLEQTLIKELRPPYNILLRDDKTYPYLFVSSEEAYPKLSFHRGTKRLKGNYFGPFPSAQAVRESMQLLQKLFQVRQCEDSIFRNRDRPCLQHQIKRCKAPCVGLVSSEEYAQDVQMTMLFLDGRNEEVMQRLIQQMEQAAAAQAFERAALYRDQLMILRRVQEQQHVDAEGGDADVVAVAAKPGGVCVQILFVRAGRVIGNKAYFPDLFGELSEAEILSEFLPSYYLREDTAFQLPKEIVLSVDWPDAELLMEAIKAVHAKDVAVKSRVKELRQAWIHLATINAEQALNMRLANRASNAVRVQMLAEALGLAEPPSRMECFDISHTMGEATVASCVVFDESGPKVRDYRHFNIEGITPGDDFAAMHQALTRRYQRLVSGEGQLPDVLFIDGGKGQLAQAIDVLAGLGVIGVMLVGISKGEGRKPGLETLHFADGTRIQLPEDSPALHLIQHIRDEAHRFAITGHRARRGKARTVSALESIPGIGPKRRRDLIQHFGGMQELMRASAKDIATVPGISIRLADTIYAALHEA